MMEDTFKELPVYDDLNREEFTTCEFTPDIASTTEPLRKLASVRKIAAIEPIEGADRIVCATVDGWKLVTQKSNNFQPNDLVVFFEIDSFLPVEERYEFLRKSSFRSTKHLGDGFKIKTIKLKGQVSQGLILPISEFYELDGRDCNWYPKPDIGCTSMESLVEYAREGDDLTEWLGVKKYEKPLDPRLAGRARGNFPSWIRKTDQERVQNLLRKISYKFDKLERWEATLKLDGSSMTIYLNGAEGEEKRFGVCSRNLDLEETVDNTFWQVARKEGWEEKLRAIGRNLAIQGELMGPGVQGNRENLKEHALYVFDIWDIDAQRYLLPTERLLLQAEHLQGTTPVPFLGTVSLGDFGTDGNMSIDAFLKYADRSSLNHAIGEGVVFKAMREDPHRQISSFKVINNKFLLAEKD